MSDEPITLVTTKPESEIAADIKRRLEEAMAPVCALMDEAAGHGLLIRWDAIAPKPPTFKHAIHGPRIEKHY